MIQIHDDGRPAVPRFSAVPAATGLYDPAAEHDSCGVAFVVDAQGRRSHRIVQQGLTAWHNLEHRGAAGAEPSSGDGAGILIQIPEAFFRAVVDFPLPAAGSDGASRYAVGMAFLPVDEPERAETIATIERIAVEEGATVLGWREVPVEPADLGPTARSVMPVFAQLFLAGPDGESGLPLERRAFCIRKRAERDT
ncbi:MAG TPA: glutamate synthase subunit alpha, partial [Mycobacteriales bacterium]|nr:glutamate synthase subunit alpha [Mycobacteriales bacterium]